MVRRLLTFFDFCFGVIVKQGSVFSPFLFAVYLNDLVDGGYNSRHNFVILYADDILILTSALTDLQRLLHVNYRNILARHVCQHKQMLLVPDLIINVIQFLLLAVLLCLGLMN